jgi:dipeptidyl-peptidase III
MKLKHFLLIVITGLLTMNCSDNNTKEFQWQTDQFADIRILRYEVPGFDSLNLQQKKLAYYLSQAALSGRDIIWDQNYKHNLYIRDVLENIYKTFSGNKKTKDFEKFVVYLKRVWFSNGIHHHYSEQKLDPGFDYAYFEELAVHSDAKGFPLAKGETVEDMLAKLKPILFDPTVDPIRTNTNSDVDMVKNSAVHFYEGVTQKEVENYYGKIIDKSDKTPISYGLNSRLEKDNGKIVEKTWKVGGVYSGAIERVVYWLEKSLTVVENDNQKKWIEDLIQYNKTGDLKIFDEYNIDWLDDTKSLFDAVLGFTETYADPLGFRGTWESIISFKDLEATKRVETISNTAKWFEENSPIMDEHKRVDIKGVTGKVITVLTLAGDAYPNSPLGINLPNADWIRATHGSKSVTLGNISHAYDMASATSGLIEEYFHDEASVKRFRKYGSLSGNLHTDLHEVIGHGSGKINEGVGSPAETLKNYASVIEEARADLVALYYLMDPKLIELGLMPSLDVGKAEYDNQINNGLMRQLVRIKLGDDIKQSHMRNRQMLAEWAYEMGKADNVIEKFKKDNKTYFKINNYDKLREIYGEQLREIQRVKSEGDYERAKELVETYGVKIDYDLHKEVLERYEKLHIAPYAGFITAILEPVMQGDEIVDVKVKLPKDFAEQNLMLSEKYSYLPINN